LMLRFSFKQEEAARAIEDAVAGALKSGYRTADIVGSKAPPAPSKDEDGDTKSSGSWKHTGDIDEVKYVDTAGMTDAILSRIGAGKKAVALV
jgi:isocitrate/isopropylmalate dehydrogenase